MYKQMDEMVGRVMAEMNDHTVLFVLSDHGFKSFRRGVSLNTWLYRNGYLALKEGAEGREWLQDVDWKRTRAYAIGLNGLYINLKGREGEGTVDPGREFEALKRELIQKLTGLMDDESGEVAVREVFDAATIYAGPYRDNSPELIIGYNDGYRASWESVIGKVTTKVFEENRKSWSGDHCIDPKLVPGVLFCNRPIHVENPSIVDIAPTVLTLFGVGVPPYMEGTSLILQDRKPV
jgi:predicted AlkP superfamily phosphohydrolase/phosphomutase